MKLLEDSELSYTLILRIVSVPLLYYVYLKLATYLGNYGKPWRDSGRWPCSKASAFLGSMPSTHCLQLKQDNVEVTIDCPKGHLNPILPQ